MKYKTKSSVIEAVQWTGSNLEECKLFCPIIYGQREDGELLGAWLGFPPFILRGDWIVKTDDGQYKQLTDKEFCDLYEPMKE
jgi:hypothetical protein